MQLTKAPPSAVAYNTSCIDRESGCAVCSPMRDSTKLLGHVWLSSFFSGFNADFIELSYITNSLCLFQPPDFPSGGFFISAQQGSANPSAPLTATKMFSAFPHETPRQSLKLSFANGAYPFAQPLILAASKTQKNQKRNCSQDTLATKVVRTGKRNGLMYKIALCIAFARSTPTAAAL